MIEGSKLGIAEYSREMQDIVGSMVERLSVAIGLERSPDLAMQFSELVLREDGAMVRVIAIDPRGPVVFLDEKGVAETSLLYPEELAPPCRPLSILSRGEIDPIAEAIREIGARETAQEWIHNVTGEPGSLTRSTFSQLSRWIDFYAPLAYRWITLASMRLEADRAGLKKSVKQRDIAQEHSVQFYVRTIDAIGALMMLVCSSKDRTWLQDMAFDLPWYSWTPSLRLCRERSFVPAIQGAIAASAFGPPVLERYLDILETSRTPLSSFDAVLGMTAIARKHPDYARLVHGWLEKRLAESEDRVFGEALLRSASAVLTAPHSARFFLTQSMGNIAHEASGSDVDVLSDLLLQSLWKDVDCLTIVDGYFPAILGITLFDVDKLEEMYPLKRSRSRAHTLKSIDAREAILRSATEHFLEPAATSRTVH
ncbi:hypothetical protein [Burkholderia sp. 9120]|uniref:hypothetical protein n=1 Tax=Burkholderia sp. 9120 TaxID=1500897 RepID=UPI000B0B6561|nr:hypothetical protein [Burkholderia sp. 9120]